MLDPDAVDKAALVQCTKQKTRKQQAVEAKTESENSRKKYTKYRDKLPKVTQ